MYCEWTQSLSRSFSQVLRECRSIEIYFCKVSWGKHNRFARKRKCILSFLRDHKFIELHFFSLLLSFDILEALETGFESGMKLTSHRLPPCLNVLKHVAEPLGHDLLYTLWALTTVKTEDTACNVRVYLSVKSNCGACKLLFHHMLWLFSYLFTRRFILKGKVIYFYSFVCGPEALIPTKELKNN